MAESTDHSIFIGDVAPEVHDQYLESFFKQYFPSVKSAKVITDPLTQRSKGYGFVRFGSEAERDRALIEMNGVYVSNRPIRVSLATAKRTPTGPIPGMDRPAPSGASAGPLSADADPANTTLFIGGLSTTVTEDQLRAVFARYGDLIYTKIPQGKGCGFVQFVDRKAAEYSMQEMNGQIIGGTPVRISWGKSSTKATQLQGGGAAAAGAYGYAPYGYGYDAAAYGYYADPYAAAAYPGYSVDPYLAYSYSAAAGGAAYPGGTASGTTASSASSHGAQAVTVYDPAAAVSVEKLNTAYVHRHLSQYTGAFLRAHVS